MEGETIEVDMVDDADGKLHGLLKGEKGWFPRSCVRIDTKKDRQVCLCFCFFSALFVIIGCLHENNSRVEEVLPLHPLHPLLMDKTKILFLTRKPSKISPL